MYCWLIQCSEDSCSSQHFRISFSLNKDKNKINCNNSNNLSISEVIEINNSLERKIKDDKNFYIKEMEIFDYIR